MADETSSATMVKFNRYSVLFQALGTIFGAAMFLLFGQALGNVGLTGMLMIVVLGHVITGAVAYTTSEIASNKRIGGGGEYALNKATHGIHIGGAIGVALYVAQTISITFYAMAVAIGLQPIIAWCANWMGMDPFELREVALVVMGCVFILNMLGGDVTVKFLYPIVAVIGIAVLSFFAGVLLKHGGALPMHEVQWAGLPDGGIGFWAAFALVFPAFTGNTMGIGLSGELADPQTEIPWGTKLATLISFVVYGLMALFLSLSGTQEELLADRMIVATVSVWSPLVYAGLIVASLSSLIGSMLVSPRTLQAMATDGVIPGAPVFRSLWGRKREPVPALILSMGIAVWLLFVGELEFIAGLVTMFFLITYMADCSASLLENVSSNPSYRPAQKAPWWLSIAGVFLAFLAAVNIDVMLFVVSVVILVCLFFYARWMVPSPNIQSIFTSVLFRIERTASLMLRSARMSRKNWQPMVLAVDPDPLQKRPFTLFLDWIGTRHGTVNLCQVMPYDGPFKDALQRRHVAQLDMERYVISRRSHVIPDVILSSNLCASMLDKVQAGGYHTNTTAFAVEAGRLDTAELLTPIFREILDLGRNVLILRYTHRLFGNRRRIYIWWSKPENGQLMVILSYILLCQKAWEGALVTICYVADQPKAAETEQYLHHLIETSRFQIGALKYSRFEPNPAGSIYDLIAENSTEADLVFLGLSENQDLAEYMSQWSKLERDAIFVRSNGEADLSD